MHTTTSGTQHYARIKYDCPHASQSISKAIQALYFANEAAKDILVICIGTDRSTGDSLGPLVGTKLLESTPPFSVLGTLENPVHAANLTDILTAIRLHAPKWTIAVDASLGNSNGVGLINIGCGPLQPGAGVNKKLPAVGDIYITGVVNVGGFMEYFVLQNTRLSLVVKMADVIARGILAALAANKKVAGTS